MSWHYSPIIVSRGYAQALFHAAALLFQILKHRNKPKGHETAKRETWKHVINNKYHEKKSIFGSLPNCLIATLP